jgi:hypothetical protein
MPSRSRTATAIALTLAAGAATLLTGCASTVRVGAGAGSAAPTGTSSAPSGSASAPAGQATSSSSSSSAAAPVLNGTGHSGLTISNGTSRVLMNGTSVDFGTVVRDLAWNPDGTKAAFIDGNGNLDTANPDGSGRVLVARAPSGENWSHPTWQVTKADKQYEMPARDNIFFAASQGGVLKLKEVSATAANGTPTVLGLGSGAGAPTQLPQTGNAWPSAAGKNGTSVYANAAGEVYIRDDYLRQQGDKLAPGSEPALSADGGSVAFVRSVGGHDHLFVQSLQSDAPARDLTPQATTDYTEPAWSPDDRTLAVRTADGIATLPADGSAAPTRVSSVSGLPAYRG